jgi:hypothetical protein
LLNKTGAESSATVHVRPLSNKQKPSSQGDIVMMRNVVIAGYARSPFTLARKGALAKVRPDDLTAQVIKALIERTGVDPS